MKMTDRRGWTRGPAWAGVAVFFVGGGSFAQELVVTDELGANFSRLVSRMLGDIGATFLALGMKAFIGGVVGVLVALVLGVILFFVLNKTRLIHASWNWYGYVKGMWVPGLMI